MSKDMSSTGRRIRISKDSETLGAEAAEFVAEEIRAVVRTNGSARVIFATGCSQLNFIERLIGISKVPWHRVTAFHLDEYVGLDDNHGASFRKYLRERLFERLKPRVAEVHYLDPNDVESYAKRLRKGPVDVACIGIGENGHIAFNDPPVADFYDNLDVKLVELDEACRRQQVGEGWFESLKDTPTHAATLTIPSIMRARCISCVVPDERKAKAVREMFERFKVPSTSCPASILWTHPRFTLWLDDPSASSVVGSTLFASVTSSTVASSLTIPGFVDLQCNGYRGVDFSSTSLTPTSLRKTCRAILRDGCCAAIVCTIITSPVEVYERNLPMIADMIETDDEFRGRVLGIHLEGPFISSEDGARGCHPKKHVARVSPDDSVRLLRRYATLARGHIRIVTIAADADCAPRVCEAAASLNVRVSLGHQGHADARRVEKLCDLGASLATHVLNGLPNMIHRHRNPIWSVLAHDALSAMVIADGHHVPDAALCAILRAKTVHGVILTSDVSPAAGLRDGKHDCFGQTVYVEGRRVLSEDKKYLAGSGALMVQCANHALSLRFGGTRLSVRDVEEMAFYAPLKAIGLSPKNVRSTPRVLALERGRFSVPSGE